MRFKLAVLSIITVATVLIQSCASDKNLLHDYQSSLPGVIPINDTLFCDQTENSNFHYLEYLYWTSRIFGEDSEEYKNALPNDSIWYDYECIKYRDKDQSYRHPAYRDYPIVGITQQQARDFCKWRSDRVFEYCLIKKGILDFDPDQSADRYFTIEKYFNAQVIRQVNKKDTSYLRRVMPDTSFLYPEYRLPNWWDRALILDYVDSTEYYYHLKYPKKEAEALEETPVFQMAIEPCIYDPLPVDGKHWKFDKEPMRPVESGVHDSKKVEILYNIRGNAAEWGESDRVTYGGGWAHNVQYIMKNDSVYVDSSNAWTGFRCVAQWKKWDP